VGQHDVNILYRHLPGFLFDASEKIYDGPAVFFGYFDLAVVDPFDAFGEERLDEGLFGGEPCRKALRGILFVVAVADFAVGENAAQKTILPAHYDAFDPSYIDNVYADS
jgi:hypothetical protein